MKYKFIFIIIINLINFKAIINLKNNSYSKFLRRLWEEGMEYEIQDENESESLIHCEKSNYKYFSFILTGATVTFEHFVSKDNAVS